MEEYDIYVVKKGDSLWLISKKYNISVDDLININNLESINLKVGDKLYVPKQEIESNESGTYIVQKGDTIFMGNNE